MTADTAKSSDTRTTTWQDEFLQLLPMITRHARFVFRYLDPEAHEEAVSEVVASSLCAYHRLAERGETDRAYGSALAKYAVARYRSGRRVGTSQCVHDVYASASKKSGRHTMCSLDAPQDDGRCDQWVDALINTRRNQVPDQVAIRIDLPNWLSGQTSRNRQIARRLSLGYSANEVARELSISKGRVSQLRREMADSWNAFINPVTGPAACVRGGLA